VGGTQGRRKVWGERRKRKEWSNATSAETLIKNFPNKLELFIREKKYLGRVCAQAERFGNYSIHKTGERLGEVARRVEQKELSLLKQAPRSRGEFGYKKHKP